MERGLVQSVLTTFLPATPHSLSIRVWQSGGQVDSISISVPVDAAGNIEFQGHLSREHALELGQFLIEECGGRGGVRKSRGVRRPQPGGAK